MKDQQTENLRIRVTPEEKKQILENAKTNEMKMSDYVRFASLGNKQIETRIETKTITEITIK
jgi:uncharacterized protein (DUF1778 family)